MADHLDECAFEAADDEHVRREKAKARILRSSAWWKNQLGRGQCHYCGRRLPPRELTMDHVVPIIRGGCSTRGNVVPCCASCNHQKRHRLPVEWAEYLERLRQEGAPRRAAPRDGARPGGGDGPQSAEG